MNHKIASTINLIGEHSTFEGTIKVEGELRINGVFRGKELNMDHVTVGKTGRIKSNINANSTVIEGTISGNIYSKIRTMLLPTAKILGDIHSPELIIQNGVMWVGQGKILSNPDTDIKSIIEKELQ